MTIWNILLKYVVEASSVDLFKDHLNRSLIFDNNTYDYTVELAIIVIVIRSQMNVLRY